KLGSRLLLLHVQNAVADVLRPHPDNVTTSLPAIEQKRERQSRPGSDGMVPLELRDLGIRPTVKTCGSDADGPYLARGIVGTQPDVARVLHHHPQRHP